MNRSTIDIDQMLRRRGGKLLYEGPEGRVAQCPDGLILSDITSGKALCGCLSFLLLGVSMGMISCCSPAVLGNLMMDIMPGMLGGEQGTTAEERDVRRAQMIQNTIS